MVKKFPSLTVRMKVKASGSFTGPTCVLVIILALGFSVAAKAQVPADDSSPARLHERIVELYQQGKLREAITLAEKLVVLTKRAKGDYPITQDQLDELLGSSFERVEDNPVEDSLPLYAGKERWQIWRRKKMNYRNC
jgi:hypothetical protein